MMTPPLSISAMPRFTRVVPVTWLVESDTMTSHDRGRRDARGTSPS
jgi:hypothetical protein